MYHRLIGTELIRVCSNPTDMGIYLLTFVSLKYCFLYQYPRNYKVYRRRVYRIDVRTPTYVHNNNAHVSPIIIQKPLYKAR